LDKNQTIYFSIVLIISFSLSFLVFEEFKFKNSVFSIYESSLEENSVKNSKVNTEEKKNVRFTIPTQHLPTCNCVAFRIDDVQDFSRADVSIEVINFFMEKKIPITLGIIGNMFSDDKKILEYIREIILTIGNDIDIANHGWNHEKFTLFSKEEQSQLIKKTNDKIFQTLGESPKIFIPPFHNFNKDTIDAAEENGILIFSANAPPNFKPLKSTGSMLPLHRTAIMSTQEYSTGPYVGLDHSRTLAMIKLSLSNYGFAIISMHPPEFTIIEGGKHGNKINPERLEELELLIEKIQADGHDFVQIEKIKENFPSEESFSSEKNLQEMNSARFSSPRTQVSERVSPYEIQCNNGLNLIVRLTAESPNCLYPSTILRLLDRNWSLE